MRLTWDDTAREYTSGLSQGVLYPEAGAGVAWNGLISVTESGGQSPEIRYLDGRRYMNKVAPRLFSGSISAFTYPDEFEPCIGISGVLTEQDRQSFGFSYRTNSELHIVYNAMVAPSKRDYQTTGIKIGLVTLDWNFVTLPVKIPGGKSSSHLVIILGDSSPAAITDLEALIYGNDTDDAVLPDPADVISIFESYTTLRIDDNGDGTWTATGPSSAITMLDASTFQIAWPSAIFIDATSYTISSL